MSGSVEDVVRLFAVLNEFFVSKHTLELSILDEGEVLLSLFVANSLRSSSDGVFASENVAILFKDKIDKSFLTNTGRSDKDQRLVLQRSRVEGMEVLLTVDKNVVLKQ